MLFRKIGDKFNKVIPCIILLIVSIISTIYFYKISITENIMVTYYNTFTRIFSLLLGLTVGFVHSYYGTLIHNKLKNKNINRIIFYSYIFILMLLFIFIDAKSNYFPISMILVTLITCRLIDYGIIFIKEKINIFEKVLKKLSSISYEVYLVQYPIIFLFQYINIQYNFKIVLMILLVFVTSYIINFCLKIYLYILYNPSFLIEYQDNFLLNI
mgnify:CR=1 FL=1